VNLILAFSLPGSYDRALFGPLGGEKLVNLKPIQECMNMLSISSTLSRTCVGLAFAGLTAIGAALPVRGADGAAASPALTTTGQLGNAAARRRDEFQRVRAVAQAQASARVIVQLDVPNYDALAAASRVAKGARIAGEDARLSAVIAAARQAELAKLGGAAHTVHRAYGTIPFVAMTVSAAALDALERSPAVLGINEDRVAQPLLDNTVNIVGASASWVQGYDGSGWYVAILDTGIRSTHNFFAGKTIVQACFSSGSDGLGDCPNGTPTDTTSPNAARHFPGDTSYHGTHVAGIATGNAPTRVPPLYGVARGANIIAIQVFSDFPTGLGSQDSDRIAAHEWLYSLRTTYNIAAGNMSLGGGGYSNQAVCDTANAAEKAAIDNLRAAGIAMAVATGNGGRCTAIAAPGCISSVIGVGNTQDSDVEWTTSDFHSTLLDIYAPGTGVLSSVGSSNNSYASYTGTSMATPHVAGAWALLRQANPDATVQDILDVLHSTGDSITGRCLPVPAQRRIQIDEAIGQLQAKFRQPPDNAGEDLASNVDEPDLSPSAALADDFLSDGRPIHAVRWWGSELAALPIDGWLIGFHEPLSTGGTAAAPLGLYFCAAAVVEVRATALGSCDAPPVRDYRADLADCCLVHAGTDSRSALVPAQHDAFHEQECFAYDLTISALAGARYVDSGGTCVETATGNSAAAAFWGWHTTATENGSRSALQSVASLSGPNWLFGPWTTVTPTCSSPNMAFELRTEAVGDPDCNNNGTPDACETAQDCQPNGVFDSCEIASGDVADCNGNTFPDECDITAGAADCQPNGAIDQCEIASGAAADCNDNAIPDQCDISAGAMDCQPNGAIDACEIHYVDVLSGARPAVLGFVDIAAAGVPLNLGDDEFIDVTMPFTPLGFPGPTLGVANNGGVGLLPGTGLPVSGNPNPPLPSGNAFGGSAGMILYWDDLHETTGNVYYQTIGSTPNRTFVVQWDDLEQFDLADGSVNGNEITFQLQIFETAVNSIVAQYLYVDTDFLNPAYSHGASATVGYQQSLTSALQWSYNTASVNAGLVISLLDNDLNDNGRPDACDPSPPLPASSLDANRSLALMIPAPATAAALPTALRVRMVDLQNVVPPNPACCPAPDFSAFEAGTCMAADCDRWVGPPFTYYESSDVPAASQAFQAARLQCTPFYQDWSATGVFSVYGAEIVPSSTYAVESVGVSCAGNEATCPDVSSAVQFTTGRSGDVDSPFQSPAPPLTQPNALDVTALVNSFRHVAGAPLKIRAKLQPDLLNLHIDVNALDVVSGVDAFRGFAYAYDGPCPCPSTVTCNATPCTTPSPCGGGACIRTCATGPKPGEFCTADLHCGVCAGGSRHTLPCDADADCPDGVCELGVCGSGFCRDRCGRCN
jgi:subtilisin family serine protease